MRGGGGGASSTGCRLGGPNSPVYCEMDLSFPLQHGLCPLSPGSRCHPARSVEITQTTQITQITQTAGTDGLGTDGLGSDG